MTGMKRITNLVVGLRATSLNIATIKSMSLLLPGVVIRSLDLNRMALRRSWRTVLIASSHPHLSRQRGKRNVPTKKHFAYHHIPPFADNPVLGISPDSLPDWRLI